MPGLERADRRVVYFFPTPSLELAQEQWRHLNRAHSARVSAVRCMIPGKRCPTCNACGNCPYRKAGADKGPNVISWDRMAEAARENEMRSENADSPVEEDGGSACCWMSCRLNWTSWIPGS